MSECKYYQELISRMLDRDLSKRERAAVMEHLDSCSECAAMYEAFSMLSNNVSANLVEPPEELTEDIMANIRRSEMIRKNRKTSRQMKTIIASAACVAVLVAVVGGFSVIKNLRKQNTVYEPRRSESSISVDPSSGSTAADSMTQSAVVGTNSPTPNMPPIQFGETHVSSSAAAQPGETVLPTFPPTPVPTQNSWYGNNSQQQGGWYNTDQHAGNWYPTGQQQQQSVQQPVVTQSPSGGIVVVQPQQAPNYVTVAPTQPTPTPTPEPVQETEKPFFGLPFLFGTSKEEAKETVPPYAEPTQPVPTEVPYVEQVQSAPAEPPYVEPPTEPVYEEPAYEEPVYQEPVYEEPIYEEPAYQEPVYEEPVYEEPVYEEPVSEEPVYEEPTYEEPVYEEQSKEPVRIDLTDKDADKFISALLGIKEEAAATAEEAYFTDGTEYVEGQIIEGMEFIDGAYPDGEVPVMTEQSEPYDPDKWDEILPDDTEPDETDILVYEKNDNTCELEIRLFGSDVYLIYDNEDGNKICAQGEYDAETYRLSLDEFINGNAESAVQRLTEKN